MTKKELKKLLKRNLIVWLTPVNKTNVKIAFWYWTTLLHEANINVLPRIIVSNLKDDFIEAILDEDNLNAPAMIKKIEEAEKE